MDRYETESKVSGLRNWTVPVPGTTVTCAIGRWDSKPHHWIYSLWTAEDCLIIADTLDIPREVTDFTPEQVARIAYLLHVDYGPYEDTSCGCWGCQI